MFSLPVFSELYICADCASRAPTFPCCVFSQFRLASLFFPGEETIAVENPDKDSDSGEEAREYFSWWPHLANADNSGQELGGGAGEAE